MKCTLYFAIVLSLLLLPSGTRLAASEQVFVLDKFLRESAGLNAEQIDSVHRGKAVAIVLDSPTPDVGLRLWHDVMLRPLRRAISGSRMTSMRCASSQAILRFNSSAIRPSFLIWMDSPSTRRILKN